MQIWTDLCDRKSSYAAGNNFMRVGTNLCNRKCFMQLETILCEFERICATGKLLCSCKQFYASLDKSVRQEMLLCSWKSFYASLDGSVRQESSNATGNNFVQVTVGRNSISNFPAKLLTGICKPLLHSYDSSHSQSQSGKRLLLASRGHPARTPPYQGSCIDPTHLSHPLDPIPDPPFC